MRNYRSPQADSPAAAASSPPPVSQLLAALTAAQHQLLLAFAARRLRRHANTPWAQRLLALISPEVYTQRSLPGSDRFGCCIVG